MNHLVLQYIHGSESPCNASESIILDGEVGWWRDSKMMSQKAPPAQWLIKISIQPVMLVIHLSGHLTPMVLDIAWGNPSSYPKWRGRLIDT